MRRVAPYPMNGRNCGGMTRRGTERIMLRLTRIAACVLGAWLWGASVRPAPAVAADDFVFNHENVMGTSLELRVRADGADAARRAEDRVLREIDRLAAIFSGYDAASELSRCQSAGPSTGRTPVSPEHFCCPRGAP